jgi:hypothetical protein
MGFVEPSLFNIDENVPNKSKSPPKSIIFTSIDIKDFIRRNMILKTA